jgi:hypothetical protein
MLVEQDESLQLGGAHLFQGPMLVRLAKTGGLLSTNCTQPVRVETCSGPTGCGAGG